MALDPYQQLLAGSRGTFSQGPSATPPADPGAESPDRLLNRMRGLKTRLNALGSSAAQSATQAAEAAKKAPLGRYTTLGTAGLLAGQQALQGNFPRAIGEGFGSLAGGGLASLAFRGAMAAPGPLGAVARVGIPLAGSILGGTLGGNIAGGTANAAQEAAASPGGPDVSVAGIPLTQAARERQQRERDLAFAQQQMNALGTTSLELDKQALAMQRDDEILRQKAMLPIQEQINRMNLVNAQAMLASQAAAQQQVGRTAGLLRLAQGAQAETGATLRTAISQNPYMGATLSAPSISFG